MKKILIAIIVIAALLLVGAAEYFASVPTNAGADGLVMRAENGINSVGIGSYLQTAVYFDGERLEWEELRYEVTAGKDCAVVFYNGSLLGLGRGDITVRAWLREDEEVSTETNFTVTEALMPNRYTLFEEQTRRDAENEAFEKTLEGFPESYRVYLRYLHELYPQWVFEPFFTGMDFYRAVMNESVYDRNLTLLSNYADIFKSRDEGDYDRETDSYIYKDVGWVTASPVLVSFYMDPRNFLDEYGIFQFESLAYSEEVHTEQGVEGILKGSFMYKNDVSCLDADGNTVESDETYSQVIMRAARKTGVNPYYLAAKIRQEIGSSPSRAATGKCEGYEGLYNLYNIGASDGEGNIERGLEWASQEGSYQRPWVTIEKSIVGGAEWIAASYVDCGQDTGYLQKFNVNPDGYYELYTHQYMTNAAGAFGQAISAHDGYDSIGMLSAPIVFSIPVFENMPGSRIPAAEISAAEFRAEVSERLVLRSGPSALYDKTAVLEAGTPVTVKRVLLTDAEYYMNRMYLPYWYEVEYQIGKSIYTGWLSAEYVEPEPILLDKGDSYILNCTLEPSVSDDVIYYMSNNASAVSVDDAGRVTGVGEGSAAVIAYTSSGAVREFIFEISSPVPR